MSRTALTARALIVVTTVVAMLGGSAARADIVEDIALLPIPPDADNVYRCEIYDLPTHDFGSDGLISVSTKLTNPGIWDVGGLWRTWDRNGSSRVWCAMYDLNAGQPDDDGDDDSGSFFPDAHLGDIKFEGGYRAHDLCTTSVGFSPTLYLETPEETVSTAYVVGSSGQVSYGTASIDWSDWGFPGDLGGSFRGAIQPGTESGMNDQACYGGSGTTNIPFGIEWVSMTGELIFWSYDG